MKPEELFEKNTKLAYHMAHKWRPKAPHLWEDIVQECLLGLWRACLTFDPEKGTRFSTYAGVCIDNQVRMLLRRNEDPMLAACCSLDDRNPDNEGRALLDFASLPQPVGDLLGEFRAQYPVAARYLLDGSLQRELQTLTGYSQPMVGRIIKKQIAEAREDFDFQLTSCPQRKPMYPIGWDLRTEAESGPVKSSIA